MLGGGGGGGGGTKPPIMQWDRICHSKLLFKSGKSQNLVNIKSVLAQW